MAFGPESRTMPFRQRKGVLSNSPTQNEDTCESDVNEEERSDSNDGEGSDSNDGEGSDSNDEEGRDGLSPAGQNLIPFLLTIFAKPSCPTTTIPVLGDHDDDVVCLNEAPSASEPILVAINSYECWGDINNGVPFRNTLRN
jgi:hypothetical protein